MVKRSTVTRKNGIQDDSGVMKRNKAVELRGTMVTIHITIPEEVLDELGRLSVKNNESRAMIIQKALKDYFKKER